MIANITCKYKKKKSKKQIKIKKRIEKKARLPGAVSTGGYDKQPGAQPPSSSGFRSGLRQTRCVRSQNGFIPGVRPFPRTPGVKPHKDP